MFTLIRKIIYYLVAVALRAWQTELINRLELKDLARKEVNKNEESSKTSEKSE